MAAPIGGLRQTVRRLLRTPGFTFISVLTLALGVGATAAIFSVVDPVLLRPLPYPAAERLVSVGHLAPAFGPDRAGSSEPLYLLYAAEARSLESLGIHFRTGLSLGGTVEPQRADGAFVTPSVFEVLGTAASVGRTLRPGDGLPGAPPVAVLGHGLWQRVFGGDEAAVGRVVEVNGVAREIVGVMPRGFRYPGDATELWIPFTVDPAAPTPGGFSYPGVARLSPGATLAGAEAELTRVLPLLPERYPGPITADLLREAGIRPVLTPLRDEVVGGVETALLVVGGTVALVLLLAWANVANLFLVRAEDRRSEVAVRVSMGADRIALWRQFMGESAVIALAAGAIALFLGHAAARAVLALSPFPIPRLDGLALDGRVIGFTLAVSLAGGLLFGAVQAARYRRPELATPLREGGRGGSAGRGTQRTRNALVVVQVALALLLLVGSALLLRSFRELRGVDPGFSARDALSVEVALPGFRYQDGDAAAALHQRLIDDVAAMPGVRAVGAVSELPLRTEATRSRDGLLIEERPLGADAVPPLAGVNLAAPGYFDAIGIPLRAGRTFERRDHEQGTGAVLVSETLAERHLGGSAALGKRIAVGVPGREGEWRTVVGIVGDVRDVALERPPEPMVYYPLTGLVYDGRLPLSMTLVVSGSTPTPALLAGIRERLAALDPDVPLASAATLAEIVDDATARTAFTTLLLGIAALIALLLGAVGIYGVIAYVVGTRRREFGVRLALGARSDEIARMVLRQGLTLAAVGVAIGLLASVFLGRAVRALLYGVEPTDPLSLAGGALLLLAVAALASWLPARRAARVDPATALRQG